MLNRVTFILAAVCTLTLSTLAGCVKTFDPAPEQDNPIQFQAGAGSLLLNDDVTKSSVVKSSFAAGDAFTVYGWHKRNEDLIFSGNKATVTLGNNGTWTYPNIKQWEWDDTGTDYYDFLAIYPATSAPATPGTSPLSASVSYNAVSSQFDLMASGLRRSYDASMSVRQAVVPLHFTHLLCAIRVVITNKGTSPVTLNSLYFRELVVSGTVNVTLRNDGDITSSLTDLGRDTNNDLFGFTEDKTVPAKNGSVDGTYIFPEENEYDLLIPQELNTVYANPVLVLHYNGTGSETIYLKDIKRQDDPTRFINKWEAGVRYTYYVDFNLDGGVQVTVITTEWDNVTAQTPGIML